jgi:hypothetical protein
MVLFLMELILFCLKMSNLSSLIVELVLPNICGLDGIALQVTVAFMSTTCGETFKLDAD